MHGRFADGNLRGPPLRQPGRVWSNRIAAARSLTCSRRFGQAKELLHRWHLNRMPGLPELLAAAWQAAQECRVEFSRV